MSASSREPSVADPETDVPAHVRVFVDILGEARAIDFLLTFGGATFYLPIDPKGNSEIEQEYGHEGRAILLALREQTVNQYQRIPVAKDWISQRLRARGLTVAKIARKLHITDTVVRSHLAKGKAGT